MASKRAIYHAEKAAEYEQRAATHLAWNEGVREAADERSVAVALQANALATLAQSHRLALLENRVDSVAGVTEEAPADAH